MTPAIYPKLNYHNQQIQNAIDFHLKSRPTFAIIDKGRTAEEYSCIWVEKGHFYGMGYIDKDNQFDEISEAKDYVKSFKSNQYMMQLIYTFAEKYPGKVKYQNETFNNFN